MPLISTSAKALSNLVRQSQTVQQAPPPAKTGTARG